jgi:hypothetical protein
MKKMRFEAALPIDAVKPNSRNARTHSQRQIRKLKDSIEANGFGAPILVDADYCLIAGHARLRAMKELGKSEIPAIVLEGLTPVEKRALMLADNRIALDAGWDRALLAIELPELEAELVKGGSVITVTGFTPAEVDELHLDFDDPPSNETEDEIKPSLLRRETTSRVGDLWHLGNHRLLHGDARSQADHTRLMAGETAAMACHDVPYNVRVADVVGRGRTKHREFAMASGEMTRAAYVSFLTSALQNSRAVMANGAVAIGRQSG